MKLFKPKCAFCGGRYGFLHSVNAYGIYGELGKRYYYHPECMNMVEMEPEKFGHKMVDMAIYLNDRLKECKRETNDNIAKDFKEKVEECHANNFSRMIPGR